MSKISASRALQGLRVLDLSRVRAGPTCVRMLADFGADVIRIEPPPGVDPNEAMFAGNRLGGDFQNLNRNKRSLTLNLKKPEGLAVLNESDIPAGYGRLGNSHFEGMMRAEVARGPLSLREVNADGRGFPLNRNYLYGGYFFAFLRERYGDAAIHEFVNSYSGKLFWFPVDSNPESATGKTMIPAARNQAPQSGDTWLTSSSAT